MSCSLTYICCSFEGGILSVVFTTVATFSDLQGTWSALVSYPICPFLLLFFYIVPYPSFSYVLFIDLYLLQFPGRHSICCFPTVSSHMFLTCRGPGVPLSLIRSYPLPFPCPFVCIMFLTLPFLLCICSLIYICGSFRGGILYLLFSPL